MKKISEWLKELPSPIREKAQANFRNQKGTDEKVSELSYAIFAFNWSNTPQKWKYWSKIYDEYKIESFDNYDEANIDELVDHSEQISKRLSKYNLIWNDKHGWCLKQHKFYDEVFGKNGKYYVFQGQAFKL